MATRSLATDITAPAPTGLREDDYRTFCAALESTQRGRDFLIEYARRNRNADTGMLLDSLDRIEAMMAAEGKARDRLRDELRVLLIAIRLARPDIDSSTALTKAARLADLLDLMEKRIDDMVENKDLPPVKEEPLPAPAALSVVPKPDEPELPIPTVTSLQGPVIALVQEPTRVVVKPLTQDTVAIEPPRQEAPVQEILKQELPQPAVVQAQELQPHEWAQLEIINQPRTKTLIDAEPYEVWDMVAEAAPAPAPVIAAPPAPAPKPAAAAPAAPAAKAAPTKWLPDFGGETQIIHTKPVTAVAFMPEVTFMGARQAANEAKAQPKAEIKAEAKVEMAAVTAAATPVVTATAETVAPVASAPVTNTPAVKTVPPRTDPLAAIMALSEAERIALFT